MRAALLALVLLAGAAAPAVRAQGAPEVVAVPLPDDGGVFYWRSGPARSAPAATPARVATGTASGTARPATQLDLLAMEARLRQAIDSRLARALAGQNVGRGIGTFGGTRPVIVLPGQSVFGLSPPAAGAVAPLAEAPLPLASPPALGVTPPLPALAPLPRAAAAGPFTPFEVERALLDAGLFRAVGVHFEFDRDTLLPSARAALDVVGEALVRHPALEVEVHGHTDAVGRADYNLRLSERRAEAVRRYLLEAFPALEPERLAARGFGLERPVASNANPTGRTLNRRVEFVVHNPEDAHTAEPEPPQEESVRDRLRRIIEEEVRQAREEG